MAKCCGKSKLNIDYSSVKRMPYFPKKKDKDAWLKEQATKSDKTDKTDESADESADENS